MKKPLLNVLVVLALASGVILIALTTGLFPAAAPAPIETTQLARSQPVARKPGPARTPTVTVPRASAIPLCAAPAEGARLQVVPGAAGTHSLLVWCRGGYALFNLDLNGPAPALTKLAHLPTNMPRPGGAALADLTADGVLDLVVGVAPKEGVVHAPGSGVFLVRGRASGGYEAALPLLEMPVVALALAPVRAPPAARDLFILTRGDAAARRPGQLVWFEAGPTPLKKGAFPGGLLPRDVRTAELEGAATAELLVLASEPGRVIAVSPLKPAAEAAREVVLADGAALCAANDPHFVLARSTHDLWRVSSGAQLALTPWFRDANVGPCASGDLDRDGAPDALAVTDAGVIWLREAGESGAHELTLPAGYRALDVAYAPSERARVLALVLEVEQAQLVLLVWSALPWAEAGTLVLDGEPAREGPAVAEIPLE